MTTTTNLFPVEASSLSPPDLPNDDLEIGTIAFVVARLTRWVRIAPPGMALATFESPLARQAVIERMADALTPAGVSVQHVTLERDLPALEHIRRLATETLPGASGVVHVTGFQHAFTQEETDGEALRLFNYNRENLVNFSVKQIWWMTPDFASNFEKIAPELARYFLVLVRLKETILPAAEMTTFETLPEGPRLSPQEARQLSQVNWDRFENSLEQPVSLTQHIWLGVEAFAPLLRAGLIGEASKLWEKASKKLREEGFHIDRYISADASFIPVTSQDSLNLDNLARLYESTGLYDRAEPLYILSLAISEKVHGESHPNISAGINNLAGLYKRQGKISSAESLYARALEMVEHVLGLAHPDTATSLNNLASLYETQGAYDKAEPLYKRALTIQEQVLGAMHPDTAITIGNLGGLYGAQGAYDKAEPLYKRALTIQEQVLGAMHPDTATTLSNLGWLRVNQKRLTEAQNYFEQALAIRKSVLGPKHSHTQRVSMSLERVRREIVIMKPPVKQRKKTDSIVDIVADYKFAPTRITL